MNCNQCGRENPDDAIFCAACGHKLQSGLKPPPAGGSGRLEPLRPIPPLGPKTRRRLERLAEAWAVAILVWVASYLFLRAGLEWPLYPMALAGVAYAWIRGIRWRE